MATFQENDEVRQRADEDKKLVLAALQNETSAFTTLVTRYMPSVYAVGWSEFHERERAEELAQEVFLRAYLGLKDLHKPEFFPVWIHRIARNLASTWKRNGCRKSKLVQMVPLEESTVEIPDNRNHSGREQLATEEENAALREAVIRLPEDLRQVVLLHFSDELCMSEVARRLGLAPSSASRRLQRALILLRADLGDRESAADTLQIARGVFRPSRQAVARTIAGLVSLPLLSAEAKAALSAVAATTDGGLTAGVSMAEVADAAGTMSGGMTSAAKSAIVNEQNANWSIFWGSGKFVTVIIAAALLAGGTVAAISNRKPSPQVDAIQKTTPSADRGKLHRSRTTAATIYPGALAKRTGAVTHPSLKTKSSRSAAQAADPDSVVLPVHVIWEGGERIPGAQVRCSTLLDYASENHTTETRESARNITTIVTDKRGNAMFSLPKQSARVRLDATFPDAIPSGREVVVDPHNQVVLTLQPGHRVSGTVYREDGGHRVPAAGATVMTTSDAGNSVTSGPDGKYILTGLSGKKVEIIATLGMLRSPAGRNEHHLVQLDASSKNDPVDLILGHAASLVGGVIDQETGNPIPGAQVTAFALLNGPNHLETYGSKQDQTTVTDSNGMFSFDGLPTGLQKLKVLAEGYGDAVNEVELVSGDSNNTLLALERGGLITVNAIDQDGIPVEGATLNVMREGGWFLASRTDKNGQVTLPGADWNTPHKLWVWKHSTKSSVKEVVLNRGEEHTSVTLAFSFRTADNESPGVIIGTVKDEAGRPIKKVSIYAQQGWAVDRDVTGDRHVPNTRGEFRLERRGASGNYYISVAGKGWAPTSAISSYGSINEPRQVDFVLKRGHWLEGTVVDSSGSGISGATVRAYPSDLGIFTHAGHPGMRETTTKADGTFRLSDLPGPRVLVRSRKTGWIMADGDKATINVDQQVPLVMHRAGEIAGRVVDSAGNSVPAFIVTLSSANGDTPPVKEQQIFNENGRFRLSDLVAGYNYEVHVSRVTDNLSSSGKTLQARETGNGEITEDLLVLK